MCLVTLAAAKPGAGPYHLMPFLPVILYLASWQMAGWATLDRVPTGVSRPLVAVVVATVALSAMQQAQLLLVMHQRGGRNELADLARFAAAHRGVIEMGYGRTEALSLERPYLAFRNGSYLLDQPAIREHQLQGLEFPRATVAAIASCRVTYWLVPRGEEPFSGVNSYAAVSMRPLYPEALRQAFQTAYVRDGGTAYYDVWKCGRGAR